MSDALARQPLPYSPDGSKGDSIEWREGADIAPTAVTVALIQAACKELAPGTRFEIRARIYLFSGKWGQAWVHDVDMADALDWGAGPFPRRAVPPKDPLYGLTVAQEYELLGQYTVPPAIKGWDE
jgi:hypothetical protein